VFNLEVVFIFNAFTSIPFGVDSNQIRVLYPRCYIESLMQQLDNPVMLCNWYVGLE
jgi:hypothetical protein